MNVSNMVALFAMLPAAGILLYGLASIFIYPTSIEAKVSIVSSIATSVTVLFLISERLRESARRKLEYLNKKALTPALKVGRAEINQIEPDQNKILSQSREMLKAHGRFLGVRLYPKALLQTFCKAENGMSTYLKVRDEIAELGRKAIGVNFNKWSLLVVLGFIEQGSYNDSQIGEHRKFYEGLKETEPELANRFPNVCKETLRKNGGVVKEIEDFLINNQLEEVEAPPIKQPFVS